MKLLLFESNHRVGTLRYKNRYSQMNLVKNKQRNRISLITLNSILCIRDSLKKKGQRCYSCILPKEVLKKWELLKNIPNPQKPNIHWSNRPLFFLNLSKLILIQLILRQHKNKTFCCFLLTVITT